MPAHIGTSGWNYRHWANGRFYPPRLPATRWLEHFSRVYSTVEVNSSFYSIPSAESVARWSRTVPEGFTFALKIWKGITHYRKLHDCREFLERFFASAGGLPLAQRAPLLLQLPPHLTIDLERLESFLGDFRRVLRGARWRLAVEFRHASWLTPETSRLLDVHRVALALSDHDRCVIDEPNDVDVVYVRRHGRHYDGSYSAEQIASDAARIRSWTQAGRAVYVYYNNDIDGHAVDNARQLMAALGVGRAAPLMRGEEGMLFE